MKKIQAITDCEFRAECSTNFARQGNTFFLCNHTNRLKCIITTILNAGACFVYEENIDDVQLLKGNGLMEHLKPFDFVFVDHSFTVRELLTPPQVDLKIPSSIKGRKKSQYCRGITVNLPYRHESKFQFTTKPIQAQWKKNTSDWIGREFLQ